MDFCVYPENSRDKHRCLAPGGDDGPKVRGPMENRYLPRLRHGIFDRFSIKLSFSVSSVARTSPAFGGTSLPARSPASRSLAEGRRSGEGRWVVKKVNYFSLLVAIGKGTVDEIKMSSHGAHGSQKT